MTETKTEKKPRRPRNLGALVVQVMDSNSETWEDINGTHEAGDEALRWIKDNGEAGRTYRVARVYPSVKVGVVTSEVRTIEPAD